MTSISGLVHLHGGLLHKRQLVEKGAHDRHLTWAVRKGEVRRPRRGWYSTWPPHDPRFIAVQVGGRLTGASALQSWGAWLWQEPRITVSVPKNASRLRRASRVRVVWDPPEVAERGTNHSVGLRDALREALLELPFEEAVAVLDWALYTEHLGIGEIPALVEGLPRDVQGIVDWVDEKCQSIIESISRTRFRRAGHDVETQVPVDRNKAIDIVVDGVVGLELDGRSFHQDSFEKDRCKDLEIIIEGRAAIRASYRMVRHGWERVLLAVETAASNHRESGARVGVGNSGSEPRPPRRGPRLWALPCRRRPKPELPPGAGAGARAGAGASTGTSRRGRARRSAPSRIATIVR